MQHYYKYSEKKRERLFPEKVLFVKMSFQSTLEIKDRIKPCEKQFPSVAAA